MKKIRVISIVCLFAALATALMFLYNGVLCNCNEALWNASDTLTKKDTANTPDTLQKANVKDTMIAISVK